MLPKGIDAEGIRELSKIGTKASSKLQLPTEKEVEEAKAEIEAILPPEESYVMIPFVRQVLIGLEYAKSHFRCSMLDDVTAGKKINDSDYKKYVEGKVSS